MGFPRFSAVFSAKNNQVALVVCMDSGCLRNSSSVSSAAAAFTGDEGSLGCEDVMAMAGKDGTIYGRNHREIMGEFQDPKI